jgi:hypothetical protein
VVCVPADLTRMAFHPQGPVDPALAGLHLTVVMHKVLEVLTGRTAANPGNGEKIDP